VWDGDVLVHEISRRAQAEGDPVVEVKTYCFEDDGFAPVAHRDDGGWFHYVNDPIGTPERLVDERGEVACELRRDAWGRTEAAPGARTTTPIRFPGQYDDPETGLCYNRFRYYDPDAGRFISPDPLGLAGESKTYAYAPNTLLWLDPYGLIFARQYSLEEVRAMLAASEGRPNPLTGAPGHPGSEHVQVPAQGLRQRSCGGKTKTSFSSATTQARAVHAALNSPQGQASLAQLDSDPSLVRAPPIEAEARLSVDRLRENTEWAILALTNLKRFEPSTSPLAYYGFAHVVARENAEGGILFVGEQDIAMIWFVDDDGPSRSIVDMRGRRGPPRGGGGGPAAR
jgi:RHS repeat-associated protein